MHGRDELSEPRHTNKAAEAVYMIGCLAERLRPSSKHVVAGERSAMPSDRAASSGQWTAGMRAQPPQKKKNGAPREMQDTLAGANGC